MSKVIDSFKGQYAFLSNFYPSYIVAPTVEHVFQSLKTTLPDEQEFVLMARSAGEAKRRGKLVTLRADWDEVKLAIMQNLVFKKFLPTDMRAMLIATGDALLIEGNYWHDNYWGVCYCGTNRCNIEGSKNHLGQILMSTRSELGK